LVGRFNKGDDLLSVIIALCEKHDIRAGEVRAIGAVANLSVTEYDISKKEYKKPLSRKEVSEIISLNGNISEKDNSVFPHLHILASFFDNGKTSIIAGHLVKAEVFACEYVIDVYDDISLKRGYDEPTGLALWDKMSKK